MSRSRLQAVQREHAEHARRRAAGGTSHGHTPGGLIAPMSVLSLSEASRISLVSSPDDPDRLGRPPHLHEFVDEILARLQRAQELGELLARVVEIVGGSLGLDDELAPQIDQELPLLLAGSAASCSRVFNLTRAWLSALAPSCDTTPLSDTAPSMLPTIVRSSSISLRALSTSVTSSMVLALSSIRLARSG